jgi:threonine dehydrogenase-like Zn-dependent dehydrogenase
MPEPATGWVRIGVTAVGICGSDLHIFGGMLGDITGLQPGHEVAGVIDAVGEGVTLMTGMNVALNRSRRAAIAINARPGIAIVVQNTGCSALPRAAVWRSTSAFRPSVCMRCRQI